MATKKNIITLAVAIALIAGGAAWQFGAFTKDAPLYPIALAEGDTVSEWRFKNAYTGNAELEAKARAEITRLEGLVGGEEFTDYVIYMSIANQYDLIGDGEQEFQYLRMALAEGADTSGLAWHNLGKLMARLGAKATARMAFERAVEIQPIPSYEQSLAEFLEENYPDSLSAVAE